jgi:hypothetical protein
MSLRRWTLCAIALRSARNLQLPPAFIRNGTLVVALALALSPQTAQAHIVQFVTAVPMTVVDGVQDETAVSNIILTAVKDALGQAVAFSATLVVVEDARVVNGYLYLLILAADGEGEALMQELENARATVERVTSCDASPGSARGTATRP